MRLPQNGPKPAAARAHMMPVRGLSLMFSAYEAAGHRAAAQGTQATPLTLIVRSSCSQQGNAHGLAGQLVGVFSTSIAMDEESWFWVVTARVATAGADEEQLRQWVADVAGAARSSGCWLSGWELENASNGESFGRGIIN